MKINWIFFDFVFQEMSPEERENITPRTVMIGGKAFATYTNAKRIVKLVNDVGAVVNTDPEVNSYLKVVNLLWLFTWNTGWCLQ